jgi:hypothetical protein
VHGQSDVNCVAQQHGAAQPSDYYSLLRNCLRTIILQVVCGAMLIIRHESNKYTYYISLHVILSRAPIIRQTLDTSLLYCYTGTQSAHLSSSTPDAKCGPCSRLRQSAEANTRIVVYRIPVIVGVLNGL